MKHLLFIVLVAALAGCGGGSGGDSCNRNGYTPLQVQLVSAEQAAPVRAGGACVIRTALPPDTKTPDNFPADLRHVGESIHACLKGTAAPGEPASAGVFYNGQLWYRIEGYCDNSKRPGYNYYGCYIARCSTIDTNLAHIGPPEVCASGLPMSQWTPACWTQFFTVLGHETMHGWLGEFHA